MTGKITNGLRRKMTVNFATLADDNDEFFETRDRMSSAVHNDLTDSSDDEFFDDTRMSFTSSSPEEFRSMSRFGNSTSIVGADYNMWMAEPCSITERRKKLFQGMGMGMSTKEMFRMSSKEFQRNVTKKIGNVPKKIDRVATAAKIPAKKDTPSTDTDDASVILPGSRSESEIDFPAVARRKEEFFGQVSKQRLTRTATTLVGPVVPRAVWRSDPAKPNKQRKKTRYSLPPAVSNTFGGFFLIKNLDTGKEFIVNDYGNRLSDLHTGKQLTMEEFEKTVGQSRVVTEMMKRSSGLKNEGDNRKLLAGNSYLSKSLRTSKRHGSNLLKNISRSVSSSVSGFISDRDDLPPMSNQEPKPNSRGSEWVRVRQSGKPYKEFSALQLSQEIQAHEGSIWTIRFSLEGQYLASAGEDRVIHVWEVQECDLMAIRQPEEWTLTPLHPAAAACPSPERQLSGVGDPSSADAKKKKAKGGPNGGKKGLPDYVFVPDLVFALSEKPYCSFEGHQDDVLDLSWSRSQLLLSSSMDKTVRLWDLESGSCLKMFAHNDYVTCIQFNPVDENYFISGSLDAKIRIWNIPNRQVVDWSDLNEMVTAVCYTPDGEGAIVGTHKGNIRIYSAEDSKLDQTDQMEIQNKKKGGGKKITGFQYSPWNHSELLVTSADSRVRIQEGADTTHKFKGFKNTNSQIAAAFTSDSKYVVCASEDSQVFVWKKEMLRNGNAAKPRVPVEVVSYESFCCKDVSMAIPWPGNLRCDPAAVGISKRHSKRDQIDATSNSGSPCREEKENSNGKKNLPPLPKKNPKEKEKKEKKKAKEKKKEDEEEEKEKAREGENAEEEVSSPPSAETEEKDSTPSNGGEMVSTTVNTEEKESPTAISGDVDSAPASEEQPQLSRLGSAASVKLTESPSVTSSTNSSGPSWLSMFDGGAVSGMQSSAWGMVIVTAGLGGEIRTYQNFGLPRKVGRQGNLF